MLITNRLKKDHRTLEKILKLLERTSEDNSKERKDGFQDLKLELVCHSKAEEEVVYKPLKEANEKLRELTLEAKEEHKVAEHLLKELEALSPQDETWGPKLTVLKEVLEHHIEEEEDEMFKKMEKVFDEEVLKEMTEQFDERRDLYVELINQGIEPESDDKDQVPESSKPQLKKLGREEASDEEVGENDKDESRKAPHRTAGRGR